MTLNDLEPSQKEFQWIFRKKMKILALNVDFSSLNPDPLGSWSPGQAGVKDGYPS